MTAVAILVALAVPVGALIALLRLVDALERRRADVVARQIALTDAIHAELGPVVAPLVRRGRGGRLEVVLAMPAGQPHLARIVQLAQATLGVAAKIVLVAREPVRSHRAPAGPLALTGVRAAR